MISKNAFLSENVFEQGIPQAPTRNGYGEGLVIAGEKNKNVVALCADLTESTRVDEFAKKFPTRFLQVGVAEQNMATVAAGLAVSGKIPFISSYATFSPGRNWEQIRTTISYNNANVKIAGHHAGISVGPDGATHQAVEDIATMRVMANMTVIVPADAIEARKATVAAAQVIGPVYLRFGREKTPIFTTDATPFVPGKAQVLWTSKSPDVLIVGCGALLYNALIAAREMEKEEKIFTVVVNSHTVKPLDEKTILAAAAKCRAVVTVEEHQVVGGLGGAVAELLARKRPLPIEFIGMQGVYGESGKPSELIEKYGMSVAAIKKAIRAAFKRI